MSGSRIFNCLCLSIGNGGCVPDRKTWNAEIGKVRDEFKNLIPNIQNP